jgi:hypothetical protein
MGSRNHGISMGRNNRHQDAALVCMLIALALPGTAKSQEQSQLVDTGVILSAKLVERSVNRLIGVTPPFWTPSSEDIARLEGQLKSYLEGVGTPKAKVIAAKLGRYKRQYLGYTDGGKKRIFVNSFCHWKEDWFRRDSAIIVKDGGTCFFRVHYDLSSSRFDQLEINGDA